MLLLAEEKLLQRSNCRGTSFPLENLWKTVTVCQRLLLKFNVSACNLCLAAYQGLYTLTCGICIQETLLNNCFAMRTM